MIEGVTGLPGQGKSLFTLWRMREASKARRRVIANYPTDFSEPGLWSDMIEADNCLCVIDEAQMWFGSRAWNRNTQIELGVFQQHRKNGLDIIWIAQHENRVDVALREITAYLWRVRRFGNLILASKFTPDDRDHCLERKLIWAPSLYAHYDTLAIIGGREGEGARSGKSTALAGDLDERDHRIWNGKLYVRTEHMGRIQYRLPKDVVLESVRDYDCRLNSRGGEASKLAEAREERLARMIEECSNGRILY